MAILLAAAVPAQDTPAAVPSAATSPAVVAPVADVSQPVKLEFPLAGYSIDAYDSAKEEAAGFSMSLPVPGKSTWYAVTVKCTEVKGGKPPVQKHFQGRSSDTLLFEHMASRTESKVEYIREGPGRGEKTHFYGWDIFANGKTYTIVGSMADADWAVAGDKVKAYVGSFEPTSSPVPGKMVFPREGFRIKALDEVIPANARGNLLSLSGGVSVSVEPYTKTLKDYRAERKPSWMLEAKDKVKILAENSPTENALVTEYAEELTPADKNHPQAAQLLTWEKVILAHGELYRATFSPAQVLSSLGPNDPQTAAQIKACVESLEAMPAPEPTSVPVK